MSKWDFSSNEEFREQFYGALKAGEDPFDAVGRQWGPE